MASEHNPYVKINVGGEKLISVSPDLFGVAGDNKLVAVFSDRWDRLLDADGSYFVDYSPDVFLPLVEWLREVRDSEPDTTSVPVRLKDECRRPWVRMMRALSFDMKALRKAGIGLHEMRQAGISEESIETLEFGASDLRRGYSQEDLDAAGLTKSEFDSAARDLFDLVGTVRPLHGLVGKAQAKEITLQVLKRGRNWLEAQPGLKRSRSCLQDP